MEKHIQTEFARQANQMAVAAAFHAEPVLEWLVRAVGAAARNRALDLACGPGIVAEVIAPRVREVVGLDVTPEMIRLAHDRLEKAQLTNAYFSVASVEALPFKENEFDQVITRLSLHHFHDVAAVLSEVRRVLRPGGDLIIADVVSPEDADESALHNSLEQLRDPTHVRMFAPAELLEIIHVAGFSLVSEEEWEQQRSFLEWAQIIANPARTDPLQNAMRALARAGQGAGIALREEAGQLFFTHRWRLVVAKAN